MNSEYLKKALEKVGNPGVLVNLISRRVRQLNYHAGGASNPMVAGVENMGAADIALREIVEDKMGWEMPEIVALIRPVSKKARRQGMATRFPR
jgi:DNA-directed RNA polymerase subunit omega